MGDLANRGPLGLKDRDKPKEPKTRKPVRKVRPGRENERHPLRENASGQPCTLRLPGCRHDPRYTVLAHLRRFSWGGMGIKPHDVLAFFSCDLCHLKQEAHHPDCTPADLLRALGETLLIQIQSGKLGVIYDD